MMLLKNANDINSLLQAIDCCEGDVILRNIDGSEEFNMKSLLSRYIAIGQLCNDHGDEYEFFATNKNDEGYLMKFFAKLDK